MSMFVPSNVTGQVSKCDSCIPYRKLEAELKGFLEAPGLTFCCCFKVCLVPGLSPAQPSAMVGIRRRWPACALRPHFSRGQNRLVPRPAGHKAAHGCPSITLLHGSLACPGRAGRL
jgi:hypothetical protein